MTAQIKLPPNPVVRITRDFYELRIYFGDVLHLHIDNSKLLGMQSWTDNEHSFTIEYTLAGGTLNTPGSALTIPSDAALTFNGGAIVLSAPPPGSASEVAGARSSAAPRQAHHWTR